MIRFWAYRVRLGKCTIDEVPEKYREKVREWLLTHD